MGDSVHQKLQLKKNFEASFSLLVIEKHSFFK